jgi:hypothetical protein
MGAELFHADREKDKRTDRKKLRVALLNYTKAAKKRETKRTPDRIPQLEIILGHLKIRTF